MKEGHLAIIIGECFQAICQQLKSEKEITEFTEGLRFLTRQDLPVIVILLYLKEYAKKV